ncbi:MAG: hypothetical protein Q7R47_04985 [Candidatus Diapherotrites archaeon]|nr:hypothetical protein [Candidatus Diapherotrites archaeon]
MDEKDEIMEMDGDGMNELLAFDPHAASPVSETRSALIAHKKERHKTKKNETEKELDIQQLGRVFMAS